MEGNYKKEKRKGIARKKRRGREGGGRELEVRLRISVTPRWPLSTSPATLTLFEATWSLPPDEP
jgi:hypothetical protein